MRLPRGYLIRPPASTDLDSVTRVLIADDLDDAGQVVLDANFLRNRWDRAGFNLTSDAWVVTADQGPVVAYGHVIRDEPNVVESLGVVHPEHRGEGVGTALLDRIDTRARQMLAGVPDPRFRHAINAGDRPAAALLEARGLRLVRHFWHMETDLDRPIDPGAPLRGIQIRTIDPDQDLWAIHAVLVEAFAQDWGFHLPKAFDAWVEEEATGPAFDPTLWLLATAEGAPVGALTSSIAEDAAWVDYLGVVPSQRGRGIGAALLRRTFVELSARGLRRALVSVDAENPTGATALYERVGMRIVKRWDLWERSSSSDE